MPLVGKLTRLIPMNQDGMTALLGNGELVAHLAHREIRGTLAHKGIKEIRAIRVIPAHREYKGQRTIR
jgi:uncharacterized membrane protein